MFSVDIALRNHSAGEVTWHRSLISIRGLSRLFIFLISVGSTTMATLAPAAPSINAVNGLYGVVPEGYQAGNVTSAQFGAAAAHRKARGDNAIAVFGQALALAWA
jgi:hypothetical protein